MSKQARTRLAVGCALFALLAAPAHSTTDCWSEADRHAAKVRDLQSRLMVATLRCQAAGIDVTPAYNRFVVANRGTLQGINAVLMTRFRSGHGEAAQAEYDRYATALANAYGGDTTDRGICANTARLADEGAAATGSVARLVALHSRATLPPPLPGAACAGRQIGAAAAPAEGGRLGWLRVD